MQKKNNSQTPVNVLVIEDQPVTRIKIYSHLTFLLKDRVNFFPITDQEIFGKQMLQFERLMKMGKLKEKDIDMIFLSSHLRSIEYGNKKINAKENIKALHKLFPLTTIFVVVPNSKFEAVYEQLYDEYGIELLLRPVEFQAIKECVEKYLEPTL